MADSPQQRHIDLTGVVTHLDSSLGWATVVFRAPQHGYGQFQMPLKTRADGTLYVDPAGMPVADFEGTSSSVDEQELPLIEGGRGELTNG